MVATQIPGPEQMTAATAAAALAEFNVTSQLTEQQLADNGVSIPKLGRSRAYRLIYWRKPPVENVQTGEVEPGDITFGGAWDGEFTKNISVGWTPLPQYGQFDDSNPAEPGGPWQPSKDKYRRILRHPKGPSEFTVRQVMEMCAGDLRKLPKGVQFPCLLTPEGEAALARRMHCSFCGRWAKNEMDLQAHMRVRHTDDATIDQTARKQAGLLGDALKETSGQTTAVADKIADVLATLVARQDDAEKRLVQFQQSSEDRLAQILSALPAMIAAAGTGQAPRPAARAPKHKAPRPTTTTTTETPPAE